MNFTNCIFTHEGKQYIVSANSNDMYKTEKPIEMPDESYLVVTCWLETMPPKPHGFAPATYRGRLKRKDCYTAIELV